MYQGRTLDPTIHRLIGLAGAVDPRLKAEDDGGWGSLDSRKSRHINNAVAA